MISVEKPGSPSEILEHHGVKGMKWGVRNTGAWESWKKASNANVQSHYARKSARKERKATQRGIGPTRSSREFRAKYPTAKLQASAIRGARNRQNVRAAKFHATAKNSPERAAAKKAFLEHPDRVIGARMTRGEKVVFSLLGAGSIASAPATGPVGAGFGVGIGLGSAARVGIRRRLEKKQAGG